MFVSNTSTLVLLAKIHCLELFMEITPAIEIPKQVKTEALFHKDSYYALLIQKLIENKKLLVRPVKNSHVKKVMLQFRLDEGEAAAYRLYYPGKHKAILTDDGELIKLCKLEEIPFICSMAIVIILYEKKKLGRQNALEAIERLYTIGRYSKQLYEHFRKEVN